jgi:hypothetical protein
VAVVFGAIAAVAFAPTLVGYKSNEPDVQYIHEQIIEARMLADKGIMPKQEKFIVGPTRTIMQIRFKAPKKGDLVASLTTGGWGEVVAAQRSGEDWLIGIEWHPDGMPETPPPPGDVLIRLER